jgi:hypothetical protein
MVALLQENSQFQLPTRIRSKLAATDGSLARLALADRIAELPGIRTVENGSQALPSGVGVFLQDQSGSIRKQLPPRLLCDISRDGIRVHGLSDPDRKRILSRGWGSLLHDSVLIFLPRDDAELEVCWSILQHAYSCLNTVSARPPSMRRAGFGELPRFSRTTLQ